MKLHALRMVGLAAAVLGVTSLSFAVTGKICIDPGHGGSDPGAVGNGQEEATNVLNTSLKFKSWLDKDTNDGAGGGSWTIVMTRTTDVFVSLQGRCDISNNAAANRFMCIHNNAFNNSANGTETFCYTGGSANSIDLRNKVHTRQIQAWNRTDRGTKTAGFYVLANTNAPAELAELAFIDSAVDAVYTGNSTHQDTAAKYHMFALQNHYGLTAYTPQTAVTYTVDNSDPGFSVSGNWSTGTSATDKFGADYRYRTTAAVSDPASWTANVAAGGSYVVSAWWTAGSNRTTTAPYILPNGGGTVNKNQTINGGSWQTLGTVTLPAGNNTVSLSCWTTAGSTVIADAVRLVGPQ